VHLRFFAGTIEVTTTPREGLNLVIGLALPGCALDERTGSLRAPAFCYADLVLALQRHQKEGEIGVVVDEARSYATLELVPQSPPSPRDYQREAVEAWKRNRGRGVVVLPTGAGKTEVALMAIADRQRATLVVAPTRDHVRQWH
jgi:hypothetical protein